MMKKLKKALKGMFVSVAIAQYFIELFLQDTKSNRSFLFSSTFQGG
jgi:hypothetical protein